MFTLIQNLDMAFIKFIYPFKWNFITKIMIFFTWLGNHGVIWLLLCLLLLLSKKYRKLGILSLISLGICALIVNVSLKPLIQRARPFEEINGIILLIKTPLDRSFPSGHTAASFTMVYIFFRHIRRFFLPIVITAIMISISRLYLNVHYPTDIIASIIIGLLSGFLGEKLFSHLLSYLKN